MPWAPYERYHELLHTSDVALLPLEPTPFNSMKSDLKFVQCAKHCVVALASPTVYAETIREGETGFLYRSPEQFEERLRHLLDDAGLRQRVAERAYRWVAENRLLSQHYRKRQAWYLQMRDALPGLNAELRQRTPELGLYGSLRADAPTVHSPGLSRPVWSPWP
jgi:glycosyltransferase involved in cell wall biosynthesis